MVKLWIAKSINSWFSSIPIILICLSSINKVLYIPGLILMALTVITWYMTNKWAEKVYPQPKNSRLMLYIFKLHQSHV